MVKQKIMVLPSKNDRSNDKKINEWMSSNKKMWSYKTSKPVLKHFSASEGHLSALDLLVEDVLQYLSCALYRDP
jgi:hypothetical protein